MPALREYRPKRRIAVKYLLAWGLGVPGILTVLWYVLS